MGWSIAKKQVWSFVSVCPVNTLLVAERRRFEGPSTGGTDPRSHWVPMQAENGSPSKGDSESVRTSLHRKRKRGFEEKEHATERI